MKVRVGTPEEALKGMRPMKDIREMTQKELKAIPAAEVDWSTEIEGISCIILPTRHIHDSGYRVMEFVLEQSGDRNPIRVVGPADVLHVGGIGGWKCADRTTSIPGFPGGLVNPVGWQIDCLPKSGCLRLFIIGGETIVLGARLSSQELWMRPKERSVVPA